MAHQGYRHKSDKTVGENKASPTKVAGRGPVKYKTGTENKTPAPVKPAPTPDELRSTAWGRGSYGANGWGGASSVQPGETVSAKLKVNAPVDAVLDNVIRGSGSVSRLTSVATTGKRERSIRLRILRRGEWPSAASLTARRDRKFRRRTEIPPRIGMLGAPLH